jgi:Putative auto-transporter adhesin, head GIN domain
MYLKIIKIQLFDNQSFNKMKTKILSIITLIVIVFGISNLSYAATTNNVVVTTLTDISAINKIEVHGNVELFISDGSADQVKVYDQYYGESALIQSHNGVLRISSYKNEKLVVWVTASDLRSVSAFDNSEVKSFGNISKIEFNVDLHNTASAKLELDVFTANVSVNDRAKADLSGTANDFSLSHNVSSSVNNYNFKAAHYTENKINFTVEAKTEEVAGI